MTLKQLSRLAVEVHNGLAHGHFHDSPIAPDEDSLAGQRATLLTADFQARLARAMGAGPMEDSRAAAYAAVAPEPTRANYRDYAKDLTPGDRRLLDQEHGRACAGAIPQELDPLSLLMAESRQFWAAADSLEQEFPNPMLRFRGQ